MKGFRKFTGNYHSTQKRKDAERKTCASLAKSTSKAAQSGKSSAIFNESLQEILLNKMYKQIVSLQKTLKLLQQCYLLKKIPSFKKGCKKQKYLNPFQQLQQVCINLSKMFNEKNYQPHHHKFQEPSFKILQTTFDKEQHSQQNLHHLATRKKKYPFYNLYQQGELVDLSQLKTIKKLPESFQKTSTKCRNNQLSTSQFMVQDSQESYVIRPKKESKSINLEDILLYSENQNSSQVEDCQKRIQSLKRQSKQQANGLQNYLLREEMGILQKRLQSFKH